MKEPCSCHTSPDPSPDDGKRRDHQGDTPRPLLLTVKEAAALIGIGRSTLYRLMEAGDVASVHVGASRRVPLSAAYEFVDRLSERTIDHLGEGKRP
jgi:excisionase family DNA binding protein